MDAVTLKRPDGSEAIVPMLRIKLGIWDLDSYVIIAADTDYIKIKSPDPDIKSHRLGRLAELNKSLKLELTEQMILLGWPTEEHPDPDVIMFTVPKPQYRHN